MQTGPIKKIKHTLGKVPVDAQAEPRVLSGVFLDLKIT